MSPAGASIKTPGDRLKAKGSPWAKCWPSLSAACSSGFYTGLHVEPLEWEMQAEAGCGHLWRCWMWYMEGHVCPQMLDALLHLSLLHARLSKQKSAAGYRLHLGQSTFSWWPLNGQKDYYISGNPPNLFFLRIFWEVSSHESAHGKEFF